MSNELDSLPYLLKETSFYEDEAPYIVESEIVEWANLHAKMYLRRYKKGEGAHWSTKEERNCFVGLIAQKIFDIICQQLYVPKDHNDPVIDWRKKKTYDFKIPSLGTVEVKGFDYWCQKVLIKRSEWHGNDYCVIFKLVDELPKQVNMVGWLTRKQVEALPISEKGQRYTPFADAYLTGFDKLNPAKQFLKMLVESTCLLT